MVLRQFFHENHLNNWNWRFFDGKKKTSNSKPEIRLGWSSWINDFEHNLSIVFPVTEHCYEVAWGEQN